MYVLLSTLDIFLNSRLQHKGILWSVFRVDAAWWDRRDERLRDKFEHHCYLWVWKHVAKRHWMNCKTKQKKSAKADTPLFVLHLCRLRPQKPPLA